MSASRFLNLLGLVLSAIGAGLMLFYPLAANAIWQDPITKEPYLVGGLVSDKLLQPHWKLWLARLGPILLGIGFLLQIWAVFLE